MKEDIRKEIKKAAETMIKAARMLAIRDGYLLPVIHLFDTEEGRITVRTIGIDHKYFKNQRTKDALGMLIKKICKESKPLAVLLVAEAWIKQFDIEKGEKWNGRAVRDYTDCKDVITASFESSWGESFFWKLLIHRKEDKIIWVDEPEKIFIDNGWSTGGRFTNLLSRKILH